MQTINPIHDPLSPLNTCLDHAVGNWRPIRHSEQVIRPLHVHGAEGRGH